MSEGSFHVNHGAMDTAVDALVRATNDINAEIVELNQQLSVLHDSWIGAAKGTYDVKQKEWNDAAAGMTQLLGRTSVTLREIGHNYVQADKNSQLPWLNI